MITKEVYKEFSKNGFNVIPLVKNLKTKISSPVELYSNIKNKKNTFLLESIEGGERWAQYSIIGLNCSDSIKISGSKIEIKKGTETELLNSDNPLDELDKIIGEYKSPEIKNLPRFYGGFVGFFAYESAQYAEKKIQSLIKKESKFNEHMPDIYLVKSEKIIVYDNFNQTLKVIFNADPSKISYEEACDVLTEIEQSFDKTITYSRADYSDILGNNSFDSNFSKNEYIDSVVKIKNYIKEGDVMQVVLAQDFKADFRGDSFKLYSALREINPSPYMYYLNLDECQVVGSSPEILVRVEDAEVTLRPIAGTRKRGKDEEEDKLNEKDLLSDPKELAEHLMLIDLGRNDVGRISEIGSVKLTEKMIIERYSHVMHIVSNVVGKLSNEFSCIDALKATLPAGTLSGAPKIRAM